MPDRSVPTGIASIQVIVLLNIWNAFDVTNEQVAERPSTSAVEDTRSGDTAATAGSMQANYTTGMPFLFPDEPFPDYDWAANLDVRDFDIAVPLDFGIQTTT